MFVHSIWCLREAEVLEKFAAKNRGLILSSGSYRVSATRSFDILTSAVGYETAAGTNWTCKIFTFSLTTLHLQLDQQISSLLFYKL